MEIKHFQEDSPQQKGYRQSHKRGDHKPFGITLQKKAHIG